MYGIYLWFMERHCSIPDLGCIQEFSVGWHVVKKNPKGI